MPFPDQYLHIYLFNSVNIQGLQLQKKVIETEIFVTMYILSSHYSSHATDALLDITSWLSFHQLQYCMFSKLLVMFHLLKWTLNFLSIYNITVDNCCR